MVKVGLETGPSTPRARAAPRTNVVFPAPSSPETATTSPGRSRAASRAASASVSAGEFVMLCKDVTIGAGAACASSRTVTGTNTRSVTEATRAGSFSLGADRGLRAGRSVRAVGRCQAPNRGREAAARILAPTLGGRLGDAEGRHAASGGKRPRGHAASGARGLVASVVEEAALRRGALKEAELHRLLDRRLRHVQGRRRGRRLGRLTEELRDAAEVLLEHLEHPRRVQRCGRVEDRIERDRVAAEDDLLRPAVDLRDPGRSGGQQLRREVAERGNELRLDQLDLPEEVPLARLDLLRQRVALPGRAAPRDVRDVPVLARETAPREQLAEQLAGGPPHRPPLIVLVE